MTAMIKLRHQQPSLWHRGLAEDIEGLWEPWMLLVDKLLEDEQLLDRVYEAGTAGGEKPKTVPFGIEATSQPVSSFEHADSTLRPGLDGMRRWVGLGVIADNFIQMGCYLARQST